MNAEVTDQLVKTAIAARTQSYSPYSSFAVGAALLCADGTVFSGCNVENASFGLAICAERTAICKAISEGNKDFVAIAIAAAPLASPCGACRQFIVEFGKDIEVICVNANDVNEIHNWKISELIPNRFSF